MKIVLQRTYRSGVYLVQSTSLAIMREPKSGLWAVVLGSNVSRRTEGQVVQWWERNRNLYQQRFPHFARGAGVPGGANCR